MLRLLKYIVLFVLGYKVLKELFKQPASERTVPPSPKKQNINYNDTQQNHTAPPNTKFNDAEPIDYEEVK